MERRPFRRCSLLLTFVRIKELGHSFFMNKFRKLGLISYNGKIEVHSSLLNAVLYDKPEIERNE